MVTGPPAAGVFERSCGDNEYVQDTTAPLVSATVPSVVAVTVVVLPTVIGAETLPLSTAANAAPTMQASVLAASARIASRALRRNFRRSVTALLCTECTSGHTTPSKALPRSMTY